MLPVGINTSKILYLTGNSLISSSVNTFFNARITALKNIFETKEPTWRTADMLPSYRTMKYKSPI